MNVKKMFSRLSIFVVLLSAFLVVSCEKESLSLDAKSDISQDVKNDAIEYYGKVITFADFPNASVFPDGTYKEHNLGVLKERSIVGLVFDKDHVLYTAKRYNDESDKILANIENLNDDEIQVGKYFYITDIETFRKVTGLKEATTEYANFILDEKGEKLWSFDPYVRFFEKTEEVYKKINKRLEEMQLNTNKSGSNWWRLGNIIFGAWDGLNVSNFVGHTGGISEEPTVSSWSNNYLMQHTKIIEANIPSSGSYWSAVTSGTPNGVFQRSMSTNGSNIWAHSSIFIRIALWKNGMSNYKRNKIKNYMSYQIGEPYLFNGKKYNSSYWYCSKLQWRAYFDNGIDIDSNGGYVVYPYDILNSSQLVGMSF